MEISSGSLGHGLPLAVGTALGLRAQGRGVRVVVDNGSATFNQPGSIERRFANEGWHTLVVDGRNHAQLELALNQSTAGDSRSSSHRSRRCSDERPTDDVRTDGERAGERGPFGGPGLCRDLRAALRRRGTAAPRPGGQHRIREQPLVNVNVGVGLALSGMRPIVHSFGLFLVERAFELIKLGFTYQDVGGVLGDLPHRVLSLGVRSDELRRYGTRAAHRRTRARAA